MKNIEDITLALAGTFQAACLVKDIAELGKTDETAYNVIIHSIYELDPPSVDSIYQGKANLKMGLSALLEVFGDYDSDPDPDISRYALCLIHLERRLSQDKKRLETLRERIKQARSQSEYFSEIHPNVIANIASIYSELISTLSFRVHVMGEESHLNHPENMNKVRALLLAGIRSAVLWRQLGGSRWQLLFSRAKIEQAALRLLA